jgi:hypothetical protein
MRIPDRPLRDASAEPSGGWHACALVDGAEEEYRTLMPFARDCLQCGDKCLHFLDPRRLQERVDRLAALPFDVHHACASGRLELRTWEETYLRGGGFDQHAMLAALGELLKAGEAAFGRTRLWANMEWALAQGLGSEQLFEYESRVNLVLDDRKDMLLCVYDTRSHSAATLLNVLRTHPFVVVGERLRANPLYVPPERFLASLS